MAYTEVKEKNGKKHYYRAMSVRRKDKIGKRRVYLGSDLGKEELARAEMDADRELGVLTSLLNEEELEMLEDIRRRYNAQPKATERNRYEAFISRFTHDSTAIEGNTLTLQETASLLFEQIPPSKNMREINEVLNHRAAFDYMIEHGDDISRQFILELHRLVARDTLEPGLDDQIGRYRTLQVYIRGVEWSPPLPEQVPGEMKSLLTWYTKNKKRLHPIVVALYFHTAFELIHPFVDGNGRVGRLLMNFILHKNGYPMVNIPSAKKQRYYKVLETAQDHGNLRPSILFAIELLEESQLLY